MLRSRWGLFRVIHMARAALLKAHQNNPKGDDREECMSTTSPESHHIPAVPMRAFKHGPSPFLFPYSLVRLKTHCTIYSDEPTTRSSFLLGALRGDAVGTLS